MARSAMSKGFGPLVAAGMVGAFGAEAGPRYEWVNVTMAAPFAARNRRQGKSGRWYRDCAWDPAPVSLTV